MKLNVPVKLQLSTRYYVHNRSWAIKDVFDALVELITNSDDSYHRLYKKQMRPQDGGPILIETCARIGSPSVLIVRDRAEGMTLQTMEKKLGVVGERCSEEGDRGFMSRGAKDCAALGDLTYESIVDDKYYKAKLTSAAEYIPMIDGNSVNNEIRKSLHIERGNGTVVTIELNQAHSRLPRLSSICESLPLHFALRDIMDDNSPSEVLIRDMNSKDKPKKIAYYYPQAEVVCKEEYAVRGYPKARAKLIIYKAAEPLDDLSDKFRRSGVLIKGKRAIHECSLLQPSFEKDIYGKKFFGRIECEYIDQLMSEYDDFINKGKAPTIENPSLVIDPNRQSELSRKHPFIKELLEVPTRKLKELIDKEHAEKKGVEEDIADENLKKKFEKLAKAASKYLQQQIDDLEDVGSDQDIDEGSFTKRGILIFPTYANIAIETVRSFGIYVNRKMFNLNEIEISLKADNPAVEILNPLIKLAVHKKKSHLLYGRFSVKGLELKDLVCIETKAAGLPKAEAMINVVDSTIEEREFASDLEFEHSHYKIKDGSSKIVRLFAKHPEIVNSEVEVSVDSSDTLHLPVKGKCVLVPVHGSNYACADVSIEARGLKHEQITLAVKLGENEASAKVKIIQREEAGIPLKIEFTNEDFGNYRARWGDNEGRPYLLQISARHPSIKRYLGSAPEYIGRDSVHFRAILAEIVAESICRKSLSLESKQHAWLFQWANYKDDNLILDSVLSELQKRMKEFLPVSHQIMIEDKEISEK